jgi:integrase
MLMPRPNREPKPFYRKSKNSWYLQIGKRQISLGQDEKLAWRRYHQIMSDREALTSESATVETLFEHYLGWVEVNRKTVTYEKIRRNLSSFAAYIGKTKKASNLTGADLADWAESQTTWGPTTRNEGIGNVIRAYNWAVGKRYLSQNYVQKVPNRPQRKRRETILSKDDWNQLLSFVRDRPFRDFLEFLWQTGCRPKEARTVEARHVNLEAGLIVFPASEAKGERHERVIYLTESTQAMVKRRMELFADGPLFRNTFGRPWNKDSLNNRFKRLSQKTGKPVFAYALRHSYATQGLIDGVDSVILSQLMGHKDVSTLAKNYAHLSNRADFLRQQAARVRES